VRPRRGVIRAGITTILKRAPGVQTRGEHQDVVSHGPFKRAVAPENSEREEIRGEFLHRA
jgi:hypothetical protein